MAPLKCCVTGCSATSASHCLHSMPKDDKLRSLWLSFLLPICPHLIGLTKKQLLRKQVCQQHFDRYQMDGQGRRLRDAYPCLFSAKEIINGVPLTSEDYYVMSEHNYFQYPEENTNVEEVLVIRRADDVDFNEHSYPSCSSTQINEETQIPVSKDQVSRTFDMPSCSHDETYGKMPSPVVMPKQRASSVTKNMWSKKRQYIKKHINIAKQTLNKSGLERINEAQHYIRDPNFINKFNLLSKQAKAFLLMQLKLVSKNKMARRFNLEEKLLCLTLAKQSPKGYKLLEKMFTLPSKRTLNRLAEKICFEPGINAKVFNCLKDITKNWTRNRKLCTIVFDEVALSPHLTYNEAKDKINGFVELGSGKIQKYCDHALVIMIRGICFPWRQCIAYYFCEGTVSAVELIHILQTIVAHVSLAGLLPLGLVCDQGSTFRTALNKIRQDTKRKRDTQGIRDDGTIEVAGQNLNIFYDPPHLLKSIRNNFLTKDIIFNESLGTWKDIMFIFDIDSKLGHTRALPKLSAYHVIPNKIKKMKVSVATQVLSARTAAMLKYTDALKIENHPTMSTTADIVEFFDNLFDSVNGSPGSSKRGKLRSAVKNNSPHIKFWLEAIRKLKNMKFKDENSKLAIQSRKPRYVRVPCLDGWVTTLESFVRMSKLLLTEYGVDYYYPRYVNQDPLENFFGRIRSVNYRNINPDAHTFIYSFKSLVLSNLLSPHSQFCNCEEDDGETLISLNYLFENEEADKENIVNISFASSSSSPNSGQELVHQVLMEKISVQCSAYTAGYMCRKINKSINCKECLKTYITSEIDSIHKYIKFREYKNLKKNNLAYPSGNFLRLYREAAQAIHTLLNENCHKNNISQIIKQTFYKNLRFSWLGCKTHHTQIVEIFFKNMVRLHVHNWCKIINKIFRGAIEKKYVLKMKKPQQMAYNKYEKLRLKKKAFHK